MKKLFKKLALAVVALLTFSVGSNYSVKEVKAADTTTVEVSSFSAVSADLDDVASYKTAKGGGTSAPAVNSGEIRLYQNSSGTGGGYITVLVKENYVLREVTIGSSMKTSVAYTLDESTVKSSTASLNANGKYNVNELENSSITFYCMGTDKNSRLYVNYLSVTYEFISQGVDLSKTETMAQLDFGYTYSDEIKDTDLIAKYNGGITTNMVEGNNASTLGLDNNWTVIPDKGKNNLFPGLNAAGDIRLYYTEGGSNSISFTNEAGTIYSISLNYTSTSYNGAKVYVEGNEIQETNEEYVINSNSFVIVNGRSSGQVRISSIQISCVGRVRTYETFKNVNIRYSASINSELFNNVESFGFNVTVGNNTPKDFNVEKTTIIGDNTTFAMVLSNIEDFSTKIIVKGYVYINGNKIEFVQKDYSVLEMITYYIDNSDSLELTSDQVLILNEFNKSING